MSFRPAAFRPYSVVRLFSFFLTSEVRADSVLGVRFGERFLLLLLLLLLFLPPDHNL